MPSRAVRRGLWILFAAAIVGLVIVAMLPLLASTRLVRDRIADQMSAWSGYRVILADAPEIRVWPTFHAVLDNVTLSEWGSDGHSPVIQSERVEIDLSAVAALLGNVAFTKVRLIRPVLYLLPDGKGGYMPPPPAGGRIARSVDVARDAVKANPGKPDTSRLPSFLFGSLEFSDGRVVSSSKGKLTELVSGLKGEIRWPALDADAKLDATGIWRGENFNVQAESGEPLILFAGGNAPVSFSIKAAPLSASFDGIANISSDSFLDGKATLSSPSLRRMLEWSHTDIASSASSIGSFSVTSKINGTSKRLKLDNSEIVLDGNPGIGVLGISFQDLVPSISGTLAFDKLDLGSFLSAFTPLGGQPPPDADTRLANQLNVDLRLSAVKATLGAVAMSNVAATAQVAGGLAAFDISGATVFGGSLQAGIRINRKADGSHVELRESASGLDGASLASALGLTPLFPAAPTTISLMLKGTGSDWRTVMENGEGEINASFGAGKINALDLQAFLKRCSEGQFFPLHEVAGGSLAINGASLKAGIKNGVVTIQTGQIQTAQQRISIGGITSYLGRGLALSGTIVPIKPAGSTAKAAPVSFFVGGSWGSPFVSAVVPPEPPK